MTQKTHSKLIQAISDAFPFSREDAEEFSMEMTLAGYKALDSLEEQLEAKQGELDEEIERAVENGRLAKRLHEQLEAAQEYADEGWAWLGAALHALGVTHVFEIPDWQENLRKSNAEMAAEKALAASFPAIRPEASERSSRSEAFDPTSSATASTDAVSPAPGHQRSDLPESRSESSPASEPKGAV